MDFEITYLPQKTATPTQPIPEQPGYQPGARFAAETGQYLGPQPEETFPQRAGRVASGTAGALATGAGKLASAPFDIGLALNQATLPAGIPQLSEEQRAGLEIGPKVRPFIEKQAEKILPEGYLKPKGKGEEFLYNVAEALPAFYRPGGGFIEAATMALGSEGGRELAKKMDLGEFGQFAGSVVGAGIGAGLLKPRQLKTKSTTDYHDFSKSIAPDAVGGINATQAAVNAVEGMDLIPDDLDFFNKNILGKIKPWIEEGKVNIQNAWRDKKYINKLIRETKPSDELRKAMFKVSNGITQDIVGSAAQNPGLQVQKLLDADNLYYGLQNLSPIRKWFRKYITPSGAIKSAAGEFLGPKLIKEFPGGVSAGIYGAGAAGRGLAEIVEPLVKSRVAREEILGKTVPQLIKGTAITKPSKEGEFEITKLG